VGIRAQKPTPTWPSLLLLLLFLPAITHWHRRICNSGQAKIICKRLPTSVSFPQKKKTVAER
jgi:hypothetical protein